MIKKRTVLILGAGASLGYGYPLGSELKQDIIRKSHISFSWRSGTNGLAKVDENATMKDSLAIMSFLHFNCGFEFDLIERFRTDLGGSPKMTIDAFLECRPEFMELGKMLIAISILSCENYKHIWNNFDKNNWYGYLFNAMGRNLDSFKKNSLSVITYNYDRSFETYFLAALKSTYGLTDQECIDTFKSTISVIHVHGRLADFHLKEDAKPYAQELIGKHFRSGAKELKIIHEGDDIGANYPQVHKALSTAEQVFILGFGFDERNLQRLKLEKCTAPIYATRYGVTDLNVIRHGALTNETILFSPTSGSGIVDFLENDVSLFGDVAIPMANYPKRFYYS